MGIRPCRRVCSVLGAQPFRLFSVERAQRQPMAWKNLKYPAQGAAQTVAAERSRVKTRR